jgi:CRP/FNR family cyclic AMP-dependent transcriptional regulator
MSTRARRKATAGAASTTPSTRHANTATSRRRLSPPAEPAFDPQSFLDSVGAARKVVAYRRGDVVFSQGDACEGVMYVQRGGVKLSVLSRAGKEAIVAMLGAGDFFGEGALTGQPIRIGTATAMTASTILVIDTEEMIRVLHEEHSFSDRFVAYLLARNIRVEADLVDHLFNSSEKRLARTLLLLARYGSDSPPHRTLPRVSQETLAEMIGTTRSRVNFFMNKFKKLGFLAYGNGPITINNSLLSVVLHE